VWVLTFYIIGLYELRELKNNRVFQGRILFAILISFLLGILFFYFIPIYRITPKANLVIFFAIFGTALHLWRTRYNHTLRAKEPRERMLLLGNSPATEELDRYITQNPQLGYEVAARIPKPEAVADSAAIVDAIAAHRITLLVVPTQAKKYLLSSRELYRSISRGVELISLVDIYETLFHKIPLEELETSWSLEHVTRQRAWYDAAKRPFEIIFAGLATIVMLPVFLLITLLIKATSPGSAFFTQTRVGKNEERFTLWKFRTMIHDAERHGPRWAEKHDARVTRVGKFLRKTHLDELPQLWNVIRGDLSLVGPRPERPEFVAELEARIPFYNLRHIIRPGITGWAQINYRYGASVQDAHKKLEYELYYLKHQSLWMDAVTLIKTIKRIFVSA
jgi:exopolysaccharide biosynthesis polyprenyl glycosylphosphotransferase